MAPISIQFGGLFRRACHRKYIKIDLSVLKNLGLFPKRVTGTSRLAEIPQVFIWVGYVTECSLSSFSRKRIREKHKLLFKLDIDFFICLGALSKFLTAKMYQRYQL